MLTTEVFKHIPKDSWWLTTQTISVILVTGAKALPFLQGQLSCNIATIAPQQVVAGAYCSIKGTVQFYLKVWCIDAQCYALAIDNLNADALITELEHYAKFSRVTLEKTCQWLVQLGVIAQQNVISTLPGFLYIYPYKLQGNTLIEKFTPLVENSSIRSITEYDRYYNYWQVLTMLAGGRRVKTTLNDNFYPHDLDLPQLGAISFDKGCYRGQEIVARMHYRATLKRKLLLILCQPIDSFNYGQKLTIEQEVYAKVFDYQVILNTNYYLIQLVSSTPIPNHYPEIFGNNPVICAASDIC